MAAERTRTTSRRSRLAPALGVLAAVLLTIAAIGGYAQDALFDADEFADRAASALDDEAVRSEIAQRLTDDAILNAEADLVAVRPVIETVVDGVVGSGAFQSLFRSAASDLHRAVLEEDHDTLVMTIADVGSVIRGALTAIRPNLADKLPPDLDAGLWREEPPKVVVDIVQAGHDLRILTWVLLAAGLLSAALALAFAADRRRAVFRLGVALLLTAVGAFAALNIAREVALAGIEEPDVHAAAEGVWQAFAGDLGTLLLFLAASGAVIAAAAGALLPAADPAALARELRTRVIAAPRSKPAALARGVALLVAGIVIVVSPQTAVRIAAVLTGLFIAAVGVSELIRLTIPAQEGARPAPGVTGAGRGLIAAAAAAGLILLTGAVFVAGGGEDEDAVARAGPGCNGSEELCERPLDQVTFPGTHNSMSAADYPNWLFAQQDAGIGRQLADGVRALLIDAHYGIPTKGGTVKTDLAAKTSAERRELADALGPEALAATLRIRDRIVDSPPSGPRGVYLCHGFCEPGAIPIEDAFGEIRDFLAANNREVVIAVIEDYVAPADIVDALERSGLRDYIYEGELEPAPTLAEIGESGGRLILMAENEPGGQAAPWYRSAYDELVQETPYSFDRAALLAKPGNWRASCKPNRGTGGAPYFLVNHWIDTSPAPRPSNARIVNAKDVLLGRIDACRQRRGLLPGIVAVDFYRQGDLFGAVGELNREQRP